MIQTTEENGLILLDILLYPLNTQLNQRWGESCFLTALILKILSVSGVTCHCSPRTLVRCHMPDKTRELTVATRVILLYYRHR